MINIGLFGLTFQSGNKGCVALAYSFLEILDKLNKDNNFKVTVFSYLGHEKIEHYHGNMPVKIVNFSQKSLSTIKELGKNIKKCDYVFDFTEGDSFSDIYGINRAIKVILTKEQTIKAKVPLILGPQTYGPYKNVFVKMAAKHVIKKSKYVCSRDEESSKRVEEMIGKKIDAYTDIAFALPLSEDEYEMSNKPKIGINVSALLWNGGYNGENQFGLSMDYKDYIIGLIERIKNETDYEIHLIPHVISPNYNGLENDYRVCNELAEKYGLIAAPGFDTPMQAKKYISKMEIFIGARMHATIGAFSSGVVTIPYSYSPKFEGLYSNLGYEYVIHGTIDSLEEAIENTIQNIKEKDKLKEAQKKAMNTIHEKLDKLYDKFDKIINE